MAITFNTEFCRELLACVRPHGEERVALIWEAMKKCCRKLSIDDRDDVGLFSIMGEKYHFGGQHKLALTVYFNMTLDQAGNPADENDSIVCSFELADSPALESLDDESVEYGDDYCLDETFDLIESWPPYVAAKDLVLAYSIDGSAIQ